MSDARVGVVVPTWQRPKFLPITIACLRAQTLAPAEIVVVGSDDAASEAVVRELGCTWVNAPNFPLGDKWNAGFAALGDIDFAMIVGDDDLVGPGWVEAALAEFDESTIMVGPEDLYVLHLASSQLVYFAGYGARRPDPIGAGRIIRAQALEKVSWQACPPGARRPGLDGKSHAWLVRNNSPCSVKRIPTPPTGAILDVKFDRGITSFQALAAQRGTERVDDEWLRARFPADAVRTLLELRRVLVSEPR